MVCQGIYLLFNNENLWSNLTIQEAGGIFLVTKWTLKIIRIEWHVNVEMSYWQDHKFVFIAIGTVKVEHDKFM